MDSVKIKSEDMKNVRVVLKYIGKEDKEILMIKKIDFDNLLEILGLRGLYMIG